MHIYRQRSRAQREACAGRPAEGGVGDRGRAVPGRAAGQHQVPQVRQRRPHQGRRQQQHRVMDRVLHTLVRRAHLDYMTQPFNIGCMKNKEDHLIFC